MLIERVGAKVGWPGRDEATGTAVVWLPMGDRQAAERWLADVRGRTPDQADLAHEYLGISASQPDNAQLVPIVWRGVLVTARRDYPLGRAELVIGRERLPVRVVRTLEAPDQQQSDEVEVQFLGDGPPPADCGAGS